MGGEDEAGGLCSQNVSLASSRQPGGQQQLSMVTPDTSPGTSVTSQLPLVLASVLCTLLASVSLVALWLSVKLRHSHRDPAQLSLPAPALSKVGCYSAAGTPRYNNNKYCIRMSISLTSSGSRSSPGP